MKTVLFVAFLALGPALADQTPVAPTFVYDHDRVSDVRADARAIDDVDRISHAMTSRPGAPWLVCGSRS